MKKHLVFLLLGLMLVLRAASALASGPYELTLKAFRTDDPKMPVLAVLTLTPTPGWHAYGNIQGPSGFPTQIEATVGENAVQPLYPQPTPGPDPLDPSLTVELYDGPTPFFIPIGDTSDKVTARIKALLCSSTTCQPIKEELELTLAQPEALPLAQDQNWWPRFKLAAPGDAQASTPEPVVPDEEPKITGETTFTPRYFAPGLEVHTLSKAAALAFLAGLILNFMPCVLPVITLKLRSFIPAVGIVPANQRQAFRSHNLFFALGMMLYFLILAAVIATTGMAWGQIFQEPAAIISLTAIVFALALSLFGVYDLPLIDLKGKTTGQTHHPRLESFTTGILATILATPCSGPFLGGVLAWALIQPPDIIALVLSCIGLGMASPYLAMSLFPGLYRFLPRPGAWTLHLERILGFLLAATCVYLFGLLPTTQYLSVLILLWTIALAAWIWGKWTDLNQTTIRRWLVRGVAIGLVVLSAVFLFRPEGHPDPWKNFNMREFNALRGQKNLILDFTADWCPNCKFLEKTVLTPEKSAAFAKKHDAVLMRVDLTRHDPQLMALLESLGSKSIPILAIFPKDNPGSPLVLRDMFTSGQLRQALEQELP